MRTLRHPGIIKIIDTVETDTYIYIATERVVPLTWPALRGSLSEETAKWGLHTIASTLAFINEEAHSVHGNIRLSSIFISQSGEWRLGGLELLSSMKEEDAIIYRCGSQIPGSDVYVAPEISKGGWEAIKRAPLPAADAYGYGLLVFETFNATFVTKDQLGVVKKVPPSMHQSYKKLLNASPKARLSVAHFRDQGRRSGGFFDTPLVNISEGIDSLGLKNESEREDFLTELDGLADGFPEEFFSIKVLPELLKSVEFGGGGPRVFTAVMKIAKKFTDEDWESRLVPVIVRLFSNPDRAIRICLLDNLPNMIDHLSQKIVSDRIFPQMVTGFSDAAPLLREQTVKAVLIIITKLSDRTINGELLKHLAKTSNDDQPGIRTNTTICLGKIARNLGANTRQKVLVAAFSRSLRDPFIHARHAALLALAATADLFNEEECATKVLPALCPALVDKERLVRDQANKAFDIYMQRIKKYAEKLPETNLSANNTNGATPRSGTLQPDSAGWAGWVISSFTNKRATATGDMETKAPVISQAAQQPERSLSVPPTDKKWSNLQVSSSTPTLVQGADTTEVEEQAINDFDVDAAWGNDDDDDDPFSQAPSQPNVSTLNTTIEFDDGGEPDFEGWLNAQAQAKSKTKKPLPKGLSKAPRPAVGEKKTPERVTSKVLGSKVGVKQPVGGNPKPKEPPKKVIDTKPDTLGDDDWGDAWD